jgi:hypothetical protein
MNIDQMHIGVHLGVQKVAANVLDDYLPEEVDYYLNNAITTFVRQQYSLIKNEDRSPEAQYVNENLRTIIATTVLSNYSVVDYWGNSVAAQLPTDYLYYLNSYTNVGGTIKAHRLLQPKGLKDYIQSKSNKPLFRELPTILENNRIIFVGDARDSLITSGVVNPTLSAHLTYVKEPATVKFTATKVNCDLPSSTHQAVVDIAVDLILTDLKSLRPAQQQ